MSDLPQELLQDAVFERRGSFTLAADKAREKMRRFQLENPRRYLLQVIAGVVASGAQAIDVTTQESDLLTYTLTVDFDGPGYTAQELRDLYDAVFLPGDEPATDRLRELALGVLACQGLPARRLEIRSHGATWLWEGAETTITPDGAPAGHRVSVVGPGNADEAKLLQDACQAVPVPLRLNGQLVNSPHRRWAAAVPWPAHPFRIADGEGVVGLPYRDLDASRIAFYRHGVQFATRKLPEVRPPVSLAVEAPRIRRNVSHTDVVEDEGWRDLMAALPGVVTDLGRALATREAPAYHLQEVRSFLLHALVEWLPPEIAAQPARDWPPELRPLAQVRLFADRRGQRVSLEEILRQAGAGGLVSTIGRRMPYAPLGDWLLLNPSSEEQAVLERYVRLVDVEDALPGLLRRGGAPPQAAPPPLAPNPLARARRAGILLVVDDRPPDGRCRLRSKEGLQEFELHGWSLDVETDGGLEGATAALQEGAPALFRRLLEAVPTETGARRARLREHLLAWWRSRLDPALGDVPPADPAERLALCRHALGEDDWTARVFDTRAGAGVSLADVATWIAEGGTLAVAVGGPRRPGDHALDGTPAQLAFLSRVFGAEAVVRATLRVAEQGALAAPRPAPAPAPPQEAPAAPPAEDWLAWQKALPRRPSLASHAFHEGPLAGFLAVRTEPDELIVLRGDSVQPLETLFGRTVVGWVQTPPVEESGWSPDEERILRGQLDLLYDRLAEAMAGLAPSSPPYAVGRLRLLEHVLASPGRIRARLEADSPDDPLIRVRFLPLVGEGLGSLADLWPEVQRLGYLPVCREMWPESAGDRPVPLVGTRVPEAFYERLFLKVGGARATEAETLPFRLLQAAARELRQARARGDYRVSEAVLDGLEWVEGGTDPVVHDARTGKTLVNRSHRSIRRLSARFAEDPAVAGLLASAIFSAVNRALEDVGDEDELRFLEALLDISS